MKKLLMILIICSFMVGCVPMTNSEVVEEIKICKDAGLEYEIGNNALNLIMWVHCIKPEPTPTKEVSK